MLGIAVAGLPCPISLIADLPSGDLEAEGGECGDAGAVAVGKIPLRDSTTKPLRVSDGGEGRAWDEAEVVFVDTGASETLATTSCMASCIPYRLLKLADRRFGSRERRGGRSRPSPPEYGVLLLLLCRDDVDLAAFASRNFATVIEPDPEACRGLTGRP